MKQVQQMLMPQKCFEKIVKNLMKWQNVVFEKHWDFNFNSFFSSFIHCKIFNWICVF